MDPNGSHRNGYGIMAENDGFPMISSCLRQMPLQAPQLRHRIPIQNFLAGHDYGSKWSLSWSVWSWPNLVLDMAWRMTMRRPVLGWFIMVHHGSWMLMATELELELSHRIWFAMSHFAGHIFTFLRPSLRVLNGLTLRKFNETWASGDAQRKGTTAPPPTSETCHPQFHL